MAFLGGLFFLGCHQARSLDRTNVVFKIFQFPADKIPTIDGRTNDWNIVPESYVIGSDQFVDDNGKHQLGPGAVVEGSALPPGSAGCTTSSLKMFPVARKTVCASTARWPAAWKMCG